MADGNILDRVMASRRLTEELCRPLKLEDYVVQPEECVSPPKWHLAHTTWFFETFLLEKFQSGYKPFDPAFKFLFNSYYEAVGPRADKARRGAYSRPTVDEVYHYRHFVEACLGELCASSQGDLPEVRALLELGLHHEQQHQELLLTDIKRILHFNPSRPAYLPRPKGNIQVTHGTPRWIGIGGGMHDIGFSGEGFAFDNEKPRHRIFLRGFRIEDRLATNGRYLEFMRDGGYARPELWLSEGWRCVSREGWEAPFYWDREEDGKAEKEWSEFTLHGQGPLDPGAPVCHVSYFEADAFARWSRARLPGEGEWEIAASALPDPQGEGAHGFLESRRWHPLPATAPADSGDVPDPGSGGRGVEQRPQPPRLMQMSGEAWEWTASAYLAYPGFKPHPGAVGEYNGKFMVDQMVLRGGSCVTPRGHVRPTYRNFFPAGTRWQFSGIRLAEDA